jgi:hypothetical protein
MVKESDEKKKSEDTTVDNRDWYTQREWDRVVGWGKVPKEYQKHDDEST